MSADLRGQCRTMSEQAVADDSSLTLVKGWYDCPVWGTEEHWWTIRPDGSIYDPTASQFPSRGHGDYRPYEGSMPCEECGVDVPEAEIVVAGNFAVCSQQCYGRLVGVY